MELLKTQSILFPYQTCRWTDDMGIIWDNPISCYGTDMEFYKIRSIPIERAENLYGIAMGFIWVTVAHTKSK